MLRLFLKNKNLIALDMVHTIDSFNSREVTVRLNPSIKHTTLLY